MFHRSFLYQYGIDEPQRSSRGGAYTIAPSCDGGKWKLPLLWHIAEHTEAACGVRYNALKRAVHGITNTMLNKCLAECERDGLITREERGKRPPHVEYRLTERGRALLPALRELYIWGQGLLEKTPKE